MGEHLSFIQIRRSPYYITVEIPTKFLIVSMFKFFKYKLYKIGPFKTVRNYTLRKRSSVLNVFIKLN